MIYNVTAYNDRTKLEILTHIGIINGLTGFTLADFKRETAAMEGGVLEIEINSPGGDPFEAFAIHDSIKQLNVKTIGRITGTAASAATIILAACDIREMSENSTYLVHNASTFVQGTKEAMKDAVDELEKIDNKMLAIYMKQTGKGKAALVELMKQDKTLTADEAMRWGFVNKIIKNNNNLKIAAMAEEEKKERRDNDFESLKAENKSMKAKIEELLAKLAEFEKKEEEEKEAKIKAVVDKGVEAGLIKKESAQAWYAVGRMDYETMKTSLESITVTQDESLAEGLRKKSVAMTKAQAWEDFKSGKIKNSHEYAAILKILEE